MKIEKTASASALLHIRLAGGGGDDDALWAPRRKVAPNSSPRVKCNKCIRVNGVLCLLWFFALTQETLHTFASHASSMEWMVGFAVHICELIACACGALTNRLEPIRFDVCSNMRCGCSVHSMASLSTLYAPHAGSDAKQMFLLIYLLCLLYVWTDYIIRSRWTICIVRGRCRNGEGKAYSASAAFRVWMPLGKNRGMPPTKVHWLSVFTSKCRPSRSSTRRNCSIALHGMQDAHHCRALNLYSLNCNNTPISLFTCAGSARPRSNPLHWIIGVHHHW